MGKRISDRLQEYHACVRDVNKGCRALAREMQILNQPLTYANNWLHRREGNNRDRIGVLFYDSELRGNRWISVPISVFDSGEWEEFATRYCRVGEAENGV